jgi:hypothetical protein
LRKNLTASDLNLTEDEFHDLLHMGNLSTHELAELLKKMPNMSFEPPIKQGIFDERYLTLGVTIREPNAIVNWNWTMMVSTLHEQET